MRLAASNLAAGVATAVYTTPANRRVVFNVNACRRTAGAAKISLALSAAGAGEPVDADWIEFDAPLQGIGSVLERTGLALGPNQKLFARSDVAGVSVVVIGIEEQA